MEKHLKYVWLEGKKSGMIENGEKIKKLKDRRDLVFFHMYLVERILKWRDEKLNCLVEKKCKRIKNAVCLNLLLCPYLIKYKK